MNIDRLKAQLREDEGISLKPYMCPAGKLTIGIGRNLDDVGISEEEAYTLLENDLEWVFAGLDRSFPWWRALDDARQEVLANMAFNMGITRLSGFKKFLAALQAGNFYTASLEMLDSRWAFQVGKRAKRLAEIMRNGEK
jgi:lysozyme